ncbi:MAG: NAD(+)/NADH kinase [Lachnospiraceae bacterium]|nr:NAD(+)/NADH kinase [Lachnospiraceae bacterium]
MKKFALIRNSLKDRKNLTTMKIADYLTGKGASCLIVSDGDEIEEGTEAVIVLGGDGTMLRAAKQVVNRQIPLIGINLGTLGYLAEVDLHSIYQAMDSLLADSFSIERRMMLEAVVMRGREELARDIALNDVAIIRRGQLRVLRFMNYVNGSYLNAYSADGIVIATATGSTGYSLSAGGPIVSPEADVLLLTPVAPHTLNTRSVVFQGENEICVEIGRGHIPAAADAAVSFDGANEISVTDGDRIIVRKAEKQTNIIKLSSMSFLEVLRQKMAGS